MSESGPPAALNTDRNRWVPPQRQLPDVSVVLAPVPVAGHGAKGGSCIFNIHFSIGIDKLQEHAFWSYSTSPFSPTCFYKLSKQAFINFACLLFDTPIPHAVYLKIHTINILTIRHLMQCITKKNQLVQQRYVRPPTHYLLARNEPKYQMSVEYLQPSKFQRYFRRHNHLCP